ncbi:Acyl-CoA N-acyltransferase [Romboutsia lituseburensis]|nr:Acyl-CoA N-acyltransferase [Romboutsia lituseburensis]
MNYLDDLIKYKKGKNIRGDMVENYCIKNVDFNDIEEAFKLVKDVFMEFDAPDYSQEGVNEFINQIIENKEFINKFKTGEQLMIGAFHNNKIIGVLAISIRNHISLVFVDKKYHRRGIATKLINEIVSKLKLKNVDKIKLNSSPYAIPFYEKIGFIAIDVEQIKNGIRYVPMEFTL